MYDIQKLEQDWSMYNKKRKRPIYVVFSLLVILIIFVLTVYMNKSLSDKLVNVFNNMLNTNVNNAANNVTLVESNTSATKVIDKTVNVAKPINTVKTPSITIQTEPNPYDRAGNEPILEDVESLNKSQENNIISKTDETATKKMHLDILDTSSMTAYKDVEKRFYQTHDTDDSLFLAKSYFNRGEYEKAEYWALQTNKIDSSIEESWLLFAHSKAKLGHKQDAIKILHTYIDQSNSLEARRLLEKIK